MVNCYIDCFLRLAMDYVCYQTLPMPLSTKFHHLIDFSFALVETLFQASIALALSNIVYLVSLWARHRHFALLKVKPCLPHSARLG